MAFMKHGSAASFKPSNSTTIETSSPSAQLDAFLAGGQTSTTETSEADSQENVDEGNGSVEENTQTETTSEEQVSEEAGKTQENASPELEIVGREKTFKFKLDPNDKNLKKTLSWGLEAPRLAREKAELKKKVDEYEASVPELRGSSTKLADAAEMVSKGYYETAFKTIFGEDAFKKFYNEQVLARIEYDTATPEERLALDRKRMDREYEEKEYLLNKRLQGKEVPVDKEKQAKEQTQVLTNYGQAAIAKYDFVGEKDASARELLKNKLWTLAFNDIEEWSEENGKAVPSQAQVEKAFAHNYRLLTGVRKTDKTGASGKNSAKPTARDEAGKDASKNYARDKSQADLKDKSPLDIFKLFGGKSL